VLERRPLPDQQRDRVAIVQLAVRLQGRQRHVIEGEQREDEERDQQQVARDPPPELSPTESRHQ